MRTFTTLRSLALIFRAIERALFNLAFKAEETTTAAHQFAKDQAIKSLNRESVRDRARLEAAERAAQRAVERSLAAADEYADAAFVRIEKRVAIYQDVL
jgi:hypothetical protein